MISGDSAGAEGDRPQNIEIEGGDTMEQTIHKSWLPYTVKVHGDNGEILFQQVVDFPKKDDPAPPAESTKKDEPAGEAQKPDPSP